MVGSGSGSVWFELKTAGGVEIPLYDPAAAAQQLTSQGKSTEEFLGLTNSFLLNCRGQYSSHGFFLVRRGDLDVACTKLTASKQELVSLTIRMKGSYTVHQTLGHEDVTKTYTNLSVAYAYAVTGVVGTPSTGATTSADLNFTAQRNSAESAWQNQLYVLHIVDNRHWLNEDKINTLATSHNSRNPYWADGTADDHYGYTSSSDTYTSFVESLTDKIVGPWNTSLEDYPTEVDNFDLRSVDAWDALWGVLDEVSHTVVIKNDGTMYLTPKGHVDSTTSTERTTNKPWLVSISNDLTPNYIPGNVYVNYALIDNQWQEYTSGTHPDTNTYTSTDIRTHTHTYSVQISVTTLTAGELGSASALVSNDTQENISHTLDGRLYALLNAGDSSRTHPAATLSTQSASSFDHPDNKTALEADAKKRVILYIRSLLRPDKLFNETYQGFLDFTPTISLSSILWANTGNSAITRIRNLGINNDNDSSKSVPFLVGRTSQANKTSPSITARPSNLYDKHRQLLVRLTEKALPNSEAEAKRLAGNAAVSATTLTWVEVPTSGSARIKVYNTDEAVVPEGSIVTVFFNDQIGRWVIIDRPTTSLAKVGSSAISATTAAAIGVTIAAGTVELLYIDSAGALQTTGETITAYNIAKTTIAANSIITIKRSLLQEKWIVDMEICPI